MMPFDPDMLVPIVFLLMIPVTIYVLPVARARARRIERGPGAQELPPEVAQRLERMEQAIDAIAVEVERISEGQRFTTQLLSARSEGSPPLPDARGR